MRSRVMNIRQQQQQQHPGGVLKKAQANDTMLPFVSKAIDPSRLALELQTARLQRNILSGIILVWLLWSIVSYESIGSFTLKVSNELQKDTSSCEINLGEYAGPIYYSPESGTIGEPRCLLNSKWMRVSLHKVQFPGSDTIYDDWMWIDYHDRINVLVEDVAGESEEPSFLVFEQTKYALEGRASLAIIGGIIEAGEDATTAAKREVEEEMNGLICKEFTSLGRHRTDVNRGCGWLYGFVASKCTYLETNTEDKKAADSNQVGVADTEAQSLRSITLQELKDAVTKEGFLEVQWTATVAQAIVQLYS